MERRNTPPSEWLEEKTFFGGVRRYRWENGVKSYEMMVTVDGATIPESQLEDYNRRKKEQLAARLEQENATPQGKACPFNGGGHSCNLEKCAVFDGGSCILARIADTAIRDTEGKSCPFSPYQCRPDCGLYKNGCVLTAIQERIVKK